MTSYVAGLLFPEDRQTVALILKNKPAWMAGKWNAIGGKIEDGETPLQAMEREFAEEAGVSGLPWQATALLQGIGFEVFFFHAFDNRIACVRTMEDEQVLQLYVAGLRHVDLMPNLPVIIALALDDSGIQKPVTLLDERVQP